VDTVVVDGCTEKSWMGTAVGVTGARTVEVSTITTGISAEWEITPLVAVTRSV